MVKKKSGDYPQKRYYHKKVKPFRKLKPPEDIYQCVFCGFYSRLARLKSSKIFNGIYFRSGCNHFRPEDVPRFTSLLYEKQRELFKSLARKSIKFLRICINNKLISQEEIIIGLSLEKVMYEKNISPEMSTPASYSTTSGSFRSFRSFNKSTSPVFSRV